MTKKRRFRMALTVLTVVSCGGFLQCAARAGAPGGGTRVEAITDPALNNINAFEVTIPAKWHFQGVMLQGGSCDTMPYFVFRASSPDGLSFVERLPALSWVWGSGPLAGKNKGSCLPLQTALRAQDFLKYLAVMMKVEYVSDGPIPAEKNEQLQKSLAAMSKGSFNSTADMATAVVRYKNGSFPMKGFLGTTVQCMNNHWDARKPMFPGDPGFAASETHQCTAVVRYLVAPENQYDGIKKLWDAPEMGGKPNPAWFQAYSQRQQQQANARLAQAAQQSNAQLRAQHERFMQSQALQQRMHEDFMATMQRGTDMSMARTQQNMNARSTATSDWVDYALDRKTVLDPNTGQLSKVSSAYSYTWADSTGKMSYQTNDPTANPNGVLQGNWTKQTVVHGDGSQ